MKNLISDIASCASRKRIIPLILGPNEVEIRSFVKQVGFQVMPAGRNVGILPGQILFGRDHTDQPLPKLLFEDSARGVVFMKGDTLPKVVQEAYTRGSLSRFDLFIAVIKKDANELVNEGFWEQAFFRNCCKTFQFPTWAERDADHDEILAGFESRLPNGTTFHASAIKVLKAMDFKGTDEVKRKIDRGYGTLLKDKRADGTFPAEITGEHLIGHDVRVLSSSRVCVKPASHS